ncbi:MAG: Fibronectin type domain protein [Actinotalea sp.]|nr:Fibronectin type domain protein [Actinotalea sp.]
MSSTVRMMTRRASNRRRWVTGVVATTVPALVATLALLYPGAPVSQVDLNDGTVWLTNTDAHKLGRYNPQIDELNAGLVTEQESFDVLQDENDVLLVEDGTLSTIDPAGVVKAAQTTVPFGAQVFMSGGTVGVLDPGEGVWARTLAMVGTLAVETEDPDVELGAGGTAVVSRDGLLLAADADGTLHRGVVDDEGVSVRDDGELAGEPSGPFTQVTAVGDQLVALAGTTVHTPEGSVDLGPYGVDLVLQQPGDRAGTVLVATPSALLEVPLDGGTVSEHRTGGSGPAAAPVRVGACAHGAWGSATGSYLLLCDEADPEVTDLEGMTASATLVFRVNRSVVVLNDTGDGRLWVPMENPAMREPNWQDIEPEKEIEPTDDESEARESTQNLQTRCTAESSAPLAEDDSYGVRAGRTMVLSVIDNDASSECGILAISAFDQLPDTFGVLTPIYGGRAFQLTTAPGAGGTEQITYTVTDGRGASAPSTADLVLTVSPDAENAAPVQLRTGAMLVEQGGSATYDVLPDFRDPDGDHLILSGAASDGGGTVRIRQDGQVTFQSDGGALGRQTVRLFVSDGIETLEGVLHVDVRPVGSLAPLIDPVHAVTYVDEPVQVRPMDSVRNLSREPAQLSGVEEVAGATVVADLPSGTFTFTAASAGTYYVPFLVSAPPQQASGIARVDVRERPVETPPPTAVLDVALLPPGGEVTIDPLANDVDPGGGILVLQSVDVPAETGLRLAVLQHQLLRITSTRVLEAPVTATYTISNGGASATGQVLIQPIPAAVSQQPPVVANVTATVRTDGVVTIPVLDGAYDPDGDVLSLVRELAEPLGPGEGLLFVSGDLLRYQAPSTPMDVHAVFTVTDPAGNVTAATLTVSVHAADPATKAAPRPMPLTARVFQGETVKIPVPLTGIDPDGDGVYLLGQDQAPTKGRIVAVGPDWVEYEALPGELGTDTFTYAVEDWVGQRAVATIRVGIAARPTTSADVVSRNDDVVVRPGQSVEVRVLENDADTGGGELTLESIEAADVDATVEGDRVVVRTPGQPGVLQIAYTAINTRGGRDSAVLTVTVTPDAPILPPVAEDVVVPATDTINRTSVEVDVLAEAENPSGPLSDLRVLVHPSAASVATVTPSGNIVITLIDRAQTLPYLLRNVNPDAEGVSSYAFITVPALGDFPPMPRPGAPDLVTIAGEPLQISLDEHVLVGPGRTARITDPAKVTATKADGSPLVLDDRTLTYTALREYAGPASISFEVTDGTAGTGGSRTQVLTLPISVLAAEDYPPTFTPSVLDVAPQESTRVDLANFTSAPAGVDGGTERYTYRLTSQPPPGFQVAVVGSELTVSADAGVPRGTVGGVTLEIGYGIEGRVPAQVDFRVVASQRPLARLVAHVVPDGVEGGTSTVQVLEGAFNPFPDSGPLTLVEAVVETQGAGTAGVSGSQVTVRPAVGFIGQMVTRYRVRDSTGDPDREVEGRITVVVRGRPAAHTAPRVVEVRDKTVVLAWDAPANNGEPITGYRLLAQPGGAVTECASTTCTVGGLTNNVEYTFTVTAKNAVDWSDASPSSAPARPDAKPLAPGAPALVWGNGSVTATWTPPENPGSPIVRYEVQVSPGGPGGADAVTTSTSHTFSGLGNGTPYVVRVRAVNNAPEPGDWSAWSAPQVPAASPDAPVLSAQRFDSTIFGGSRIQVSWPDPANNGDPVSRYEIEVDGAPAVAPGARNTHAIAGSPGRHTFRVRALNKAEWGPWSPLLVVDHATVPAPMGPVTASAPPNEGAAILSFATPDTGGGRNVGYQVSVDSREFVDLAGDQRVDRLTAGTHTFTVRACNNEGCGQPSSPTTATVTTPPGDVRQVALQRDPEDPPAWVTASWQAPADTGGLPLTYEYRFAFQDGRGGWQEQDWEPVDGTASPQVDLPGHIRIGGGDVRVEVRAVNEHGGESPNDVVVTMTIPSWVAPEPDPGGGGGGGGGNP